MNDQRLSVSTRKSLIQPLSRKANHFHNTVTLAVNKSTEACTGFNVQLWNNNDSVLLIYHRVRLFVSVNEPLKRHPEKVCQLT